MTDSSSERIGRYQLLEPIGAGPNGSVWRAKVFGVAGFERQFAIKRFAVELTASPTTAQALSAAARSYGSLEHPRIARMSEFGVAQGQTFTAVELVAGLDAMRLVAESKLGGSGLPPGGSLALISQVARAVGYAHGRGLSHLGLAPSNVIVTVEGDVKVTDFGILAAAMTAHPVESPRLGSRIGYIAPEQLVGEATSAATDVYVLGVIAYELVTGQRAFYGDTPQAIAQAILAGPPADPPLPRPIVRVLARCLARSQFERFPDARAFADALDAALRVAPVPGTRKDIGAHVKATLDRYAAMNDGSLSGMVALNVGALKPTATPPPDDAGSTAQFVRPDVPVQRPAPLVGPRVATGDFPRAGVRDASPAATLPELPKPMTTVPGLAAPPPIPVPQGIGGQGTQPAPPAIPPVGASTMLGISPAKRSIPSVVARVPIVPAVPTIGARAKSMEIPRVAPKPAPTRDDDIVTTPQRGALEDVETTTFASQPDEPATAPFHMLPDPLGEDPDAFTAPTRESPIPRLPEPTDTSPSIQVLRGSDPDLPIPKQRVDSRQLPTHEMPPALVRDLKRMSADGPYTNDPLVELSLEAHGGAVESSRVAATVPRTQALAPAPTARADARPSAGTPADGRLAAMHAGEVPPLVSSAPLGPAPLGPAPLGPTPLGPAPLGDGARARDVSPAQPRMPSPSPPSLVPYADARSAPPAGSAPPARPAASTGPSPGATSRGLAVQSALAALSAPPATEPIPSGLAPLSAPPQTTPPGFGPPARAPSPPTFTLPSRQHPSRRWPVIAVVAVVAIGGGIAAYWQLTASEEGAATAPKRAHTGPALATVAGTSTTPRAAGSNAGSAVATAAGSAATPLAAAAGANAGSAVATAAGSAATGSGAKPSPGAPTADALQITSTPPGARVFIDGADQGVTPVKVAGTSDRHTMALLLPAHDLYVAEVDGHGTFSIPLTAITPSGGPAGIKVIRCKDKDRYYVFVDGKPTGMTCPTERIECQLGPHTVEVYDVVTETRRKWDIIVTDTRLSYRVRIE